MWTIILIIFIALALLTGGGILGWILQGVQAIFSLLWYGVGALFAFGLKLIIGIIFVLVLYGLFFT